MGNQGNVPIAPTEGAVCFLKGTFIGTPAGQALVEDLRSGDLVRAFFQGQAAIERVIHWIGREPPILIRSGAMAPGVPDADLFVTERHCLYQDGSLYAAGNMVNGSTIVRARTNGLKSFEYFNLKLACHSVIWANGLACETFYDERVEDPCLPRFRYSSRLDRVKALVKKLAA